ncbi:bifunctional dihydroflavonol 4-reductase/flavanone 4-reductase isoform X4 [Capsicum annuum]|uniref:bifunctional dihydroflavonol 4-reductase/flavanone 4-reductase isoform X4 n=1 Tax=Capsicum annuum TaxID=4072 RepID=UPI0007BF4218|nr:bifunctional dihydroflavonol 4-reductase/flavanone 4-reductase isoform X4 [Capsicum annuum]
MEEKLKSYCVTGGTGYIGSWLIKSLLQMGYKVHAAVRHPEKSSHLLKLAEGSDRLRLFKADLREEGSFDEAVRSCSGLFHVAAPMEFGVQATENVVKVLTEDAAFQFAKENGIDLVSTITPTVAGPFLTPTVPLSIQVLLSPITGDPELLAILTAVKTRMGSIALAHIEDICHAHIFLMENIKAEGRYICCAKSWTMPTVIGELKKEYPCPALESLDDEGHDSVIPSEISSKKLRVLGFSFKYEIDDIIQDTISTCIHHGFIPYNQKS